ncbi:hypothetical protein [Microbispora sp. KK1-11]|uniref:hypothetical protein n=1 Tax=Microbispora sp. KK1-11 TaxID=2053005 RepID=UPI00115B5B95|nr:hypothetical protein [Microbispora sp. KK1-11]TQS24121.1 hypothetical protein FLW16_36150 [Microbispora sp. KK1-11]
MEPASLPQDDEVDWDCPGIALHLCRALPNRVKLLWSSEPQGRRHRVVEYTCACEALVYELVSCGGLYMVHKVIQLDPLEHAYTGGWQHAEARLWWHRLLVGLAR